MSAADSLRLAALDTEDLQVISAALQDAVLTVRDLVYLPRDRRLTLSCNRFAWEVRKLRFGAPERRRSALTLDRVFAVQSQGIDRSRPNDVLSLLALQFEDAAPHGHLTLVFSGGATIRLEVDCIEARLADLGPQWSARMTPRHRLD
ncbi:Protein of unknown function [Faunimonas pinastri]|uniref:DUF2948 family protein n=1 Tax=Faunimonas pinastri TaxID=1855383 RepID=A0A1H9ISA2_9HYPH|nr:DUF2948 family protein [Faunimonas pinastri]SEQ77651.1 Protein of unknown function [Faunimonas pinastri]